MPTDEDTDEVVAFPRLTVKRVKEIRVEVYDKGKKLHEHFDYCDYDRQSTKIVVRGEVEDFAPGLCDTLVEMWRLSRRGELVAKIAFLLSALDNPRKFRAGMKRLRDFCGLDETEEPLSTDKTATETTTDEIEVPSVGDEHGGKVHETKQSLLTKPEKEGCLLEPSNTDKTATETTTDEIEVPSVGDEHGGKVHETKQSLLTEPEKEAALLEHFRDRIRTGTGISSQNTKADTDSGEAGKSNKAERQHEKLEKNKADLYTEKKSSSVDAGFEKGGELPHVQSSVHKKRRVNRIVTYAFPTEEEDEATISQRDPQGYAQNLRIGETAEYQDVVQSENETGRKAMRMPPGNPGYDIESYDDSGEDVRFIEVKGIDGPWTELGVGITARQYQEALGDSWWLYVVENVFSDEERTVHRIPESGKEYW